MPDLPDDEWIERTNAMMTAVEDALIPARDHTEAVAILGTVVAKAICKHPPERRPELIRKTCLAIGAICAVHDAIWGTKGDKGDHLGKAPGKGKSRGSKRR